MIGPIDLLHSSPAPHFKIFQVSLNYVPKCQSFSTIQSSASKVALCWILLLI